MCRLLGSRQVLCVYHVSNLTSGETFLRMRLDIAMLIEPVSELQCESIRFDGADSLSRCGGMSVCIEGLREVVGSRITGGCRWFAPNLGSVEIL